MNVQSHIPSAVRAEFSRARALFSSGEMVLLLSIEPEVMRFAFGESDSVVSDVELALGSDTVVREQFSGVFPGEMQLESSIAFVEDELMKGWPLPPGHRRVVLVDPVLFAVLVDSGHTAQTSIELGIPAIEELFNRLVAVSYGSPASQHGIPREPLFAARLLILREAMHHLHLEVVVLLP